MYDKVHYLDPRFKPVVLLPDIAPRGKLKEQYRPISLHNSADTEDFNKLWLIVRYMKSCATNDLNATNKFTLKGGERIKVGRVIFTVKELVNAHTRYYGSSVQSDQTSEVSSESSPGLLSNTDDGLIGDISREDTPTIV